MLKFLKPFIVTMLFAFLSMGAAHAQNRVLKTGLAKGGLSIALSQAGVPDSVALALVRALALEVNTEEDLAQDNRFTVLYETDLLDTTGNSARLLAFEYQLLGKTITAYAYDNGQASSLYKPDGTTLQPAFLRAPIEIVRITSGFGARKLPKRKRWVNHEGTDFGAPIGTKIFAAADGTVSMIGVQRGFGNVVKIEHANNTQTVYAHMSAFADGLAKDQRVYQGQVIGFVGRTGWATGPHLHYEYRVNGKPVDLFKVNTPSLGRISADKMAEFEAQVRSIQAQMQLLLSRPATPAVSPTPAPAPLPVPADTPAIPTADAADAPPLKIETTLPVAQ